MTVTWTALKPMIDLKLQANIHPQYLEDNDNIYVYLADGCAVFICLINKNIEKESVEDFDTNYRSLCNTALQPKDALGSPIVTTQYEKDDKDLKLACDSALVDSESGEAETVIPVPGIMANGEGRYVAGGIAFFTTANAGDRVVNVDVVDVDDILGYGPNTVVKSYVDTEQDAEMQGWFIPPVRGQVEVGPIGGYGFIPSQLYLRITGKKVSTNKTGTFYINIFWGKKP